MSSAGITYTQISWEDRPATRPTYDHPYEVVKIETPLVVPNGMWVLDARCGRPVGPGVASIERVKLDTDNFIWVSPETFGRLTTEYRSGRWWLKSARQVHKGELGRSVPIPDLTYVRQAFEAHQRSSVVAPRERRRSNLGWVRLSALEAAAGASWYELLSTYWGFSGHVEWLNGWWDEDWECACRYGRPLVDTVEALSPVDILGVVPVVRSIHIGQIDELNDLSWIRRGLAYTILRLLALGVTSEDLRP